MQKSAKIIITFLSVLIFILLLVIGGLVVFNNDKYGVKEKKMVDLGSSNSVVDNVTVHTTMKDGRNYLILKKNDRKIIIDEGSKEHVKEQDDIMKIKNFYNIKFSPNKKYLTYTIRGYEGESKIVYDVSDEKNILAFGVSKGDSDDIGFTSDEGYLYICSSAGLGAMRIGKVIRMSNLQDVFDVFGKIVSPETYEKNNEFEGVDCKYDNNSKQVIFTLIDYQDTNNRKSIKWDVVRSSDVNSNLK